MCRFFLISTLLFSTLAGAVPQSTSHDDPAVVAEVDFQRYSGIWFEIAHKKNFYQRNCSYSTAEYKVLSATEVSVHNICYKKNGKTNSIDGVATVKDLNVPAKLKVKFNFFQRGDYWIVDLDSNYQWAVVSAPKKKSLFILSRTAPMNPALLEEILMRLQSRGFDTDKFVFDQY